MSSLKKDFSIIIMGPLNEQAIRNIEYYKTIGTVIVSCWESNNFTLLDSIDMSDVILIKNKYIAGADDTDHIYGEYRTVYSGLLKVSSEFVIATRGDERFGNLQPMLDKMLLYKNKIICGSPHCKPAKISPFHMGWTLWGCKTELAKLALSPLVSSLEAGQVKTKLTISEFDKEVLLPSATIELRLTKSFLYALGERNFDTSRSSELVRKYFEIIGFRDLGDLVYTNNTSGIKGSKFFRSGEFNDVHQYVNSIDEM